VTFRGGGFVAASTPQMLLARHNFELLRIRELLYGTRFSRSLEIGCGFGRLSLAFAEHSIQHVAVDINNDALTLARSTYPNIDFRQASAAELPFEDGYFDLVSTWTVLQHVRPEFIQPAAREVARVTSPLGTLLMCEETRLAGQAPPRNAHTWHRTVDGYRALFSSLTLISDGFIDEIDRIPGMTSPGRVMLFRRK
jgi:ubiquinone/menaquinone biosynthesis C-methylase UbiE